MKTLFKISHLLLLTVVTVMISSVFAQAADIPALTYVIPSVGLVAAFNFSGPGLAFNTIAPMSVSDLRSFAQQNLSNFDGEDDGSSFEGMSFYTGDGDDFVDFGGSNRNFALESAEGREFVITLTGNATAGSVYIIPGLKYNNNRAANGFLLNTSGKDTNGNAVTGVSGSPSDVTDFYDFIQFNPTNLIGIKVSSSSASQLSQIIVYEEQSPWKYNASLSTRNINLGSIADQDTYQDKLGKVATPGLILSGQTRITLPIPSSATTTITFYCGAVLNSSQALQNKTDKASNTISKMGVQAVKGLAQATKRFPSIKQLGR